MAWKPGRIIKGLVNNESDNYNLYDTFEVHDIKFKPSKNQAILNISRRNQDNNNIMLDNIISISVQTDKEGNDDTIVFESDTYGDYTIHVYPLHKPTMFVMLDRDSFRHAREGAYNQIKVLIRG